MVDVDNHNHRYTEKGQSQERLEQGSEMKIQIIKTSQSDTGTPWYK